MEKLAVLDWIEAQQQQPTLSKDIRALEFLQMVYRGEFKATPQQMRAAVESLPYETPKLMAVAHFNGNFAEQLDKAIEARSVKLIEAKLVPTEQQLPPEVLKKPMSKRRFQDFDHSKAAGAWHGPTALPFPHTM